MIHLSGARKRYQVGEVAIEVLKGVSLEIARGDFVAIMGPSGSGKSTLLNIIGCLDFLDAGEYTLDGQSLTVSSEEELCTIRNQRLGFVFQQFNLIPRISAQRNVELPLVYADVDSATRRSRASALLAQVGLAERADHTPAQLSGGQQQRVAIARALINQPDVLIADEPTGSLDSAAGVEIMQIFRTLNESGITIVMVTHENEVAAYAKRIIRLRDGQLERAPREALQ
ncbi:ABC transporter ATP-binding protein [Massilia sp. TSP1-1-2]|uniref:ABC transporter ATP-binding protein n=1 Tax=Massilia sp. TSP1-1-2 TaxID=2804649 RepID=UPI003CF79F53